MPLDLERHGPAGRDPLVLVHGLGGDRRLWRPVLDAVAAEREVVLLDLPGHAAAPALPADVEPTPAALAAHLADGLAADGLGGADLVGLSLGGWVVLEMAAARAGGAVTALAPAGFWPRPFPPRRGTAHAIARAARPLLPAAMRSTGLRRGILSTYVARPEALAHEDAVAVLDAYARTPDLARVSTAMRTRRFPEEVADRVRERAAEVPVRIVWGDRDHMVQAPREPIGPPVRTDLLSGAGHLQPYDAPEAVAGVLLATRRAAVDDGRATAATG